ncbi:MULTISPECIES: hypothetical protein [unclassified Streptomyces]|uniref:hypothetical protein n=1 Tax=unclassified Streptomyces TaxID=2593676 RepID=UPI0033CBBBCC
MRPTLPAVLAVVALAVTSCTTVTPDPAASSPPTQNLGVVQAAASLPVSHPKPPEQPSARDALVNTGPAERHHKKRPPAPRRWSAPAARQAAPPPLPVARQPAPTRPRPATKPQSRRPAQHSQPRPHYKSTPRPRPHPTYDLAMVCRWGHQAGIPRELTEACHHTG